jgi:pyruvate,water dikinase
LIRRLEALRRADEPTYGGKSASLGELIAAGIPVPPGFALSIDAFHAFADPLGGQIEAMRSAPVPDAVREEVARAYAQLGENDPPVAVRSSAIGEDSAQATFAGQQETYLWVRGAEDVCDAVRDCWLSLYSAPAVAYRARLPAAPEPAMGVTVQLMVDAEISGVMFTCNPVSGDPSMVAINASWGLGLAVVGGEVTPDDYLVSKVTREVVRRQVHDKHVQYVPGERGAVRVEVPDERREVPCLGDTELNALADVARRVERHFGSRQDVEWAIARGGELFVVQSRPVTGVRPPERKPPADALSLVMGTFGVKRPE